MKIHFRRVDGERAAFLELTEVAFCGFGTGEHLAELPGQPLKYSDMNATLLKRLREKHFLDVEADMGKTWGTVALRLPDPVTLLKKIMPGDWKQARERIAAKIAAMPEFQAFVQWWETLRRSEANRRECEAIREELAVDEGLIWSAYTNNFIPFLHAGFATEKDRFNFSNLMQFSPCKKSFLDFKKSSANRNADIISENFRKIWDLDDGNYSIFCPKNTNYELFLVYKNIYQELFVNRFVSIFSDTKVELNSFNELFQFDKLIALPKRRPLSEKILPENILKNINKNCFHSHECCNYSIPFSGMDAASHIINALFASRHQISNFQISDKEIYFEILLGKSKSKDWGLQTLEKFFIDDNVSTIITEAIGNDLPTLQPWKERRRLDQLTFRRELAAFDGRTDEDAKLWPGQSGKGLSNLKSRARTSFKKRIARLEQAAEERRRTLTTD